MPIGSKITAAELVTDDNYVDAFYTLVAATSPDRKYVTRNGNFYSIVSDVVSVDPAQVTTNTNDIASVVTDQAAQDALLAAAVTQTELAAVDAKIQAGNELDPANPPVRQADRSILLTYIGGGTDIIGAAALPAAEIKDATPTAASTNAVESGGLLTAFDGKVDKAETTPAIPTDGTASATKWANEKAVADLFESLNITGQPVAPYAATFAALEAVPADTDADTQYWTVLTADDIGTGTAAAPQYPKGIYLTGATVADGWNFAVALSTDLIEGVESVPRRTYSASGPISDEDHKAVFYSDAALAMTCLLYTSPSPRD